MKLDIASLARPKVKPPLHPDFQPAVLWNRAFREAVESGDGSEPLVIGLERADGSVSRYETRLFPSYL